MNEKAKLPTVPNIHLEQMAHARVWLVCDWKYS